VEGEEKKDEGIGRWLDKKGKVNTRSGQGMVA